jgi:hypothetical protein
VKDKDQAAQLARYRLENSRELQPIDLVCTERMMAYLPGDCLELDLMDELGLAGDAVVLRRQVDPERFAVTLTLITETAGKHAFALGETGTAPATPSLGQTAEERDALVWEATNGSPTAHTIRSATAGWPMYAGGSTSIEVNANTVVIDDGRTFVFSATTISSLTASTVYGVFYNIAAATFSAVASPAASEMANAGLVFLGWQATPDGGGIYPSPGFAPDGFGGTIGSSWNEGNVVRP